MLALVLVGHYGATAQGTPYEIKKAPRMAKGDIITARTDHLFFLKCKDKREVTVATTLHDDTMVTKRRRTSAVPGGSEEISKPLAVEMYNKYMGGVDKLDQYLSYYGFTRRTFKWWRKAFFSLFDTAIVNAYILYTLSLSPLWKEAPIPNQAGKGTASRGLTLRTIIINSQQSWE